MRNKLIRYRIMHWFLCVVLGLLAPPILVFTYMSFAGIMGGSTNIGEKLIGLFVLFVFIFVGTFAFRFSLKKHKVENKKVFIIISCILFFSGPAVMQLYDHYSYEQSFNPNMRNWESILQDVNNKRPTLDTKYSFYYGNSINYTQEANGLMRSQYIETKPIQIYFYFSVKNIEVVSKSDFDVLINWLPEIKYDYCIIIGPEDTLGASKRIYARYSSNKVMKEYKTIDGNTVIK